MSPPSLRGQSLTVLLVAAIALAAIAPDLGARGGPLRPETTAKAAVFLIFLMQGLSLPTRQLLRSAANARFHAFCLACNFLLAPALMLGLLAALGPSLPENLRPGLLFLAVLPTTISSAVVMTANSRGDTAAALFATTLSNLLGILATPLLCLWLLHAPNLQTPPLGPLFASLAGLVLLPLVLGQLIRPFAREPIRRAAPAFKTTANALIVFIVFAAFCDSAASDLWSRLSPAFLAAALGLATLYLAAFSGLVWFAAPLASSDPAGRVAAFFCGSHKTIATGVPMASLLFASDADLGLLLLPLMLFHPLQLTLGGLLAPRFAAKKNTPKPSPNP